MAKKIMLIMLTHSLKKSISVTFDVSQVIILDCEKLKATNEYEKWNKTSIRHCYYFNKNK